jgi:hypothetical protein
VSVFIAEEDYGGARATLRAWRERRWQGSSGATGATCGVAEQVPAARSAGEADGWAPVDILNETKLNSNSS